MSQVDSKMQHRSEVPCGSLPHCGARLVSEWKFGGQKPQIGLTGYSWCRTDCVYTGMLKWHHPLNKCWKSEFKLPAKENLPSLKARLHWIEGTSFVPVQYVKSYFQYSATINARLYLYHCSQLFLDTTQYCHSLVSESSTYKITPQMRSSRFSPAPLPWKRLSMATSHNSLANQGH